MECVRGGGPGGGILRASARLLGARENGRREEGFCIQSAPRLADADGVGVAHGEGQLVVVGLHLRLQLLELLLRMERSVSAIAQMLDQAHRGAPSDRSAPHRGRGWPRPS